MMKVSGAERSREARGKLHNSVRSAGFWDDVWDPRANGERGQRF